MRGGGLVAFLGVRAGVAIVTMANAVAMAPAVPQRVKSPLLVWVIAATPPSSTTHVPACKLVAECLDLVGEDGVEHGKRS